MRLACSARSPRGRTAHAAKDAGFDVTLGPLFATPDEAVQLARVASMDVLGVSSLAGAHQDLVREVLVRLKEWDDAPAVVVGGIVPDARSLKDEGVFDVFGPGTPLDEVATRVVAAVDARLAATLAMSGIDR